MMCSHNKNACVLIARLWAKMRDFIDPFDEEGGDELPEAKTRQKPTPSNVMLCMLFLLAVSAFFSLTMLFLSASSDYVMDRISLMQWTGPPSFLFLMISLLRCCSEMLIQRLGDTALRRFSMLGTYLLVSLGIGFAVWNAASTLTGVVASTMTLRLITLMTVMCAVFIARIALPIAMPRHHSCADNARCEDSSQEYKRVYSIGQDFALVLSGDEWADMVERYREHIDAASEHLMALDGEWAQEIGLSLSALRGSSSGVGVGDAALLPSNLRTGASVFHVSPCALTDCVCEQYVRRGRQLLWRRFENHDLVAIYAPEQCLCKTLKDYAHAFQDLTDKYLPQDFDYAAHMGPLRIYDKDDGKWNFHRKEAETYVRYLEQFAVSISSEYTAEKESDLPF